MPRNRLQRRGITAVYAIVALTAMVAMASLGVDYARARLVKSELRTTADAAALAAVNGLPSVTTAKNLAVTVASQNKADGTTVVLDPNNDIEFGIWDDSTRQFTVLNGANQAQATAVRVTARRVAARNTAVSLTFATAIGKSACDVQAVSIASISPVKFGVIGLNWIYMGGNSSDSYWSASGSATGGGMGNIGSNGPIVLDGSSSISGNARPGAGWSVSGANKVSGSTAPLTSTLSFPNGDPGTARTTNSNINVPMSYMSAGSFSLGSNKSLTLPGGVYYFNNFTMSGSSDLTFQGPTTIYCYGNFTMSGSTDTASSLPQNLSIVMVPSSSGAAPGYVSIGSSAALYASIYAPQSDIILSGSGDVYGSIIGKSVNMLGSSAIHYDLSNAGGNGTITLVQ